MARQPHRESGKPQPKGSTTSWYSEEETVAVRKTTGLCSEDTGGHRPPTWLDGPVRIQGTTDPQPGWMALCASLPSASQPGVLPDQPTGQGLIRHHLASGEGQLIDQATGGGGQSRRPCHPGSGEAGLTPPLQVTPSHLWFPMILGSLCRVPTSAARPTSTS